MSLDEETLADVAQSGEIDSTKWPAIVEPLLQRLHRIVQSDFPLPRPYPILTPTVSTTSDPTQQSGQSSAALVTQTPTTPRTLPPVPPFPGSASSTSQVPNSQPELSQADQANEKENVPTPELPLALAQLLASITHTLRSSFNLKPPHTIQRLAELILYPQNHYRTLPSYLRALDRVVSVSSSADIFPLSDQPGLVNGITNGELSGGILWKNDANGHEKGRDCELGSDESLGGALLTPIPWLRDVHTGESGESDFNGIGADDEGDLLEPLPNLGLSAEATDSHEIHTALTETGSVSRHITSALATSNHDPLVPGREDGAVTQGELIRMEQEAGVVPVTHSSQSNPIRSLAGGEPVPNSIALGVGIGLDDLEYDDLPEGVPHARGPDVVGTVDMGLVGGRDVQVRIASPPGEGIRDRSTAVDANDAQVVLAGSVENDSATRRKDSVSDDSYVDVGTELDTGDEMQVDSIEVLATNTHNDKPASEDEDIVLVDADGVTESESERIDSVGGQVGNEAGDTTR